MQISGQISKLPNWFPLFQLDELLLSLRIEFLIRIIVLLVSTVADFPQDAKEGFCVLPLIAAFKAT